MVEKAISILLFLIAQLTAPFLAALIGKVKAFFTGKKGPSLMIKCQTLAKLLKKSSVYSVSSSYVFRLGPLVSLSASLMALAFLPFAGMKPVFSFPGDMIFVCYIFGLARFFTISAALDTASPFEGMGAAREALFGMLAELTIFMAFMVFCRMKGGFSLAVFLSGPSPITVWHPAFTAYLVLIVPALFIVLLVENSRMPVDDPATHLELTMIHEVMILDHSGPDLAMIEASSFLKMFFYSALISDLLMPVSFSGLSRIIVFLLVILIIYVVIGSLESITARFKMNHVPKFIMTSFVLVFFALILSMEAPL